VLATGGTLSSTRYQTLLERFAAGVRVLAVPAPHLVEQVEAGELDSYRTRELLAGYLAPLKAHRVDTIVLGCTHFNFLAPLIRELAGPGIAIIDTAPAVARQVALVVRQAGLAPGNSTVRAATTGDPAQVAPTFARMWHATLPLSFADC
jgi:glutamate racemase